MRKWHQETGLREACPCVSEIILIAWGGDGIMDQYENRSWFMKQDVCPVSGLPVSCRQVYVSGFPDADYAVEMAKLGDRICLVSAFGYVRSFEIAEFIQRFNDFVRVNFEEPYFYIEDYSGVVGADAGARKLYYDNYVFIYENRMAVGAALYNQPPLYRFSFNLARRLTLKKLPVYSVKTYADAISIARRFISIPPEKLFAKSTFSADLTEPNAAYRDPDGTLLGGVVRCIARLRLRLTSFFVGIMTRHYSTLLLDYLASIDWHKPGPVPDPSKTLQQPFIRKIIEAISYLKSELDEVFEQRDCVEAVLRESEQKYRLIVEHAKAGICEYDYDSNRVVSANESFLDIFGYSKDEIMSMDPVDVFTPQSRRIFLKRLSMLKEGKPISPDIVYEIITRNSGTKWVMLNSHVVYEGKVPKRATVVVTDITGMKRAEKRLREYQDRLKQLSIKVSMAEELERKRIASCLHEQVSQEIFVALMEINEIETSIDDPVLAGSLVPIKERLAGIVRKSRNLTFELSPPVLYDLGLAAAVKSLAEKLSDQYGIAINTKFYIQPEDIRQDEIKVILYRAIKELLHNCIKHAHPGYVSVEAMFNGDNLEVIVADDGIGFHDKKQEILVGGTGSGGFGLFDIREKLNHLGGELVIHSRSGQGSRIMMRIPVSTFED